MTTEHTAVNAIAWTHVPTSGKNAGKEVPLYYPLELSEAFAQRRDAAFDLINKGQALLADLNKDILKSLSGTAYTKAVPQGHALIVSHKYGPAFTALPVKVKGVKRNAVKAA